MIEKLEFLLVWCVARTLGRLPRGLARMLGAGLGLAIYAFLPRLKATGLRYLTLAMPDMSPEERDGMLRLVYRNLGWQLAEFCRMERYTRTNTADWIRYEGLENFLAAQARGKGVLIVT